MTKHTVNLYSAFGWKFQPLPNESIDFTISNEDDLQKFTDINIGFNKSNREEFLKNLEFLTRKEVTVTLHFPLSDVPPNTPHHLDNIKEYLKYRKQSFKNLIVQRIEHGKEVEVDGENIILKFGALEIHELFTRMYVCFEIYATIEDNVIEMKDSSTNEKIRLVIWGVYDGNPIYY